MRGLRDYLKDRSTLLGQQVVVGFMVPQLTNFYALWAERAIPYSCGSSIESEE